jgi:hypothetical protein
METTEQMMARTLLVDEVANELRHYRHSPMASAVLADPGPLRSIQPTSL